MEKLVILGVSCSTFCMLNLRVLQRHSQPSCGHFRDIQHWLYNSVVIYLVLYGPSGCPIRGVVLVTEGESLKFDFGLRVRRSGNTKSAIALAEPTTETWIGIGRQYTKGRKFSKCPQEYYCPYNISTLRNRSWTLPWFIECTNSSPTAWLYIEVSPYAFICIQSCGNSSALRKVWYAINCGLRRRQVKRVGYSYPAA